MENTASVRIDLSALRTNLRVVRTLCPDSRIMAMVKADAYGHGLVPVARALRDADGLAVARLQEALSLRAAGITHRILLLGTLLEPSDVALCSQQQIDVTAHDALSVAAIMAQAREYPLRVWLKLDSGMHRMGLPPGAFVDADHQLAAHPGVSELIHMTHFSCAGEAARSVTRQQMDCFASCHGTDSRIPVSMANSAALLTTPQTRTGWVRPGIMLYGSSPVGLQPEIRLQAVMSLRSRIVALRDIEGGEAVGYNRRWVSARPSRIATVGIGYGDGYPRHAGNGTPVWVNGRTLPLVGQVSMDSLTVDVTDCPRVSIGDEVILWGRELSAETIAEYAGTIAYELFTSLQTRVTREYSS